MGRQTAIVDRLRQYGLSIVEVDGWRTRGSDAFSPHGVVCHHTGGAATGEMPSLRTLINGRSDLPGPLCNVGLGRSGTCYVIAAGRANHAGQGGWRGMAGNSSVLGIEPENNGGQPWPDVQLRAYYRLAAALLSLTPAHDVRDVCGHKEWTTRKVDPHGINMDQFRAEVAKVRPTQQEGDVQLKVWNVPGNPELSLTFGKDKDTLPWVRMVIADGDPAGELVKLPGIIREPQGADVMAKVRKVGVIHKVA